MKYTDLEKNVAATDENRYEARLDRIKDKASSYLHKNRVHIFDKKKKKTIATIAGDSKEVLYQDLGLPVKLDELITAYADTPLDKREADHIKDNDRKHHIIL